MQKVTPMFDLIEVAPKGNDPLPRHEEGELINKNSFKQLNQ